jgi:hypothetical protein
MCISAYDGLHIGNMLSGDQVSIAREDDSACHVEDRVQPVGDAVDDNVAAWYLRCPAGRLIVHRDAIVGRTPDGEYAVQVWLRLQAVLRRRPFGVLTRAGLLETATDMAGHTHTTDILPAVPAGATPLLRGDECRRRRG